MSQKAHLYELAAKNKRLSIFLIFLIALLLGTVGFFIGGFFGSPMIATLIAVGFSLFMALVAYYSGDEIVMGLMGGVEADPQLFRQLHNVVEEMSLAAGLPKPKVYVIYSDASNAFATGRDPEHASIAATTGLIENLNREELQGVIGHEISHIRHFDTRYSIMMAVMVGGIVLLCDAFWRAVRWGGLRRSSNKKEGGSLTAVFLVIAIVLAILAPIFAKIIQFAMSRRREYLADNGSAELTRNPIGLAKALEKIAGDPDPLDVSNRGTQHLFIVNPLNTYSGANEWATGLFSTHPPIKERVRILKELAGPP